MPSQNQKSIKSVSFSNKVQMRLSTHIAEYSEDEIQSCFFDACEIAEFKQDVKRTAKMIENNEPIDDVEVCRRGAEQMTKEATNIRYKNRRAAVFEVLTEQFWAEESPCTPSAERIAEKYSRVVAQTAAAAHVVGLADEVMAKSSKLVVESQKKHESGETTSRPKHFATRGFFSPKKASVRTIRAQ